MSDQDHIKRGKALLSRVKQLRGHVGSDPSKASELADKLNELTANRLVAHQYADATADAQEAVLASHKLLADAGPIGAYTSPELAARYYTAVTHVAVAQVGLGMPEAAAETMRTLDDFRAQLTRPLAQALLPRTAVWALAAQSRGHLATGDVPAANAWADAALTRVARSGLSSELDEAPVVIDTERLVADTRWAAGRSDESVQHLRTAQGIHSRWADQALADGQKLSPALVRFYLDPVVAVTRELADRLVSMGDVDAATAERSALIERVSPLAGRLGPTGKALLAELQRELELGVSASAGDVPNDAGGWAPIFGEATLAPEVEEAAGPSYAPVDDLDSLVQQRAAARAEADRLEAEQAEAARQEEERQRAEREAREREAAEAAERRRQDEERIAAEVAARLTAEEAARAEAERLAAEQAERERVEAERLAAEQAERERVEAERDRLAAEEAARVEVERVAAEQAERDRLAAEEAARAEAERLAAEQAERERVEAERMAAEETERDRLAAEQAERDRLAAEEAARVEAERLAAEQAERDRLAAEQAARVEAERLAAEQAERDRVAAEQAERDRLAAEEAARVEAERLAAEEAARVDPAEERYLAAVRALQAQRDQGGRRAVRDAAEEVVAALRPLFDQDAERWRQPLVNALEELSSARFSAGDWFGSRAPSKEAKSLARG